ncbi:MAG: 3-phosphoshikimate 1-carboxyvinyltransferase [Chloroflexi bacterium]|nr:3-phosphoshikimate 1-carboxyvinyltransferase [Chloroflexota bacterium]
MRMIVRKAKGLSGRVKVPGDKSISHRALLLGAIAEGTTRIRGFLPAADCLATLACVRALGVEVERLSETELIVQGRGLRGLREPEAVLDCVGSGTTMRLLAGILAGQPFYSVLTGNEQLRRRPMGRIAEPLRRMGAIVLGRDDGRLPPLTILGGDLHGIQYSLPVASAQVKSAILLAGLYADGPTVIHEPGPARDHTERMLAAMGANIQYPISNIKLHSSKLSSLDIVVPGDISSAAYFIAAACLVPGSGVVIEGVGVNPTRTGFLDALGEMGADIVMENQREVSGEPVADVVVRAAELRGVEVRGDRVPRMIDEFPILAVVATQAQGDTVVRDAAELRVKESDRIAAIEAELRKLGACIEERADGFVVEGPTSLRGTVVDSHGDHRLAMSLAIAGLIAEGETTIVGAECIADSFPGFEEILTALAG